MNRKDRRYLYTTYLLFAIMIVFLSVNLVNFMVTEKTTFSVAEKGQIIEVDHYSGIVLRDEVIVTSLEQGVLARIAQEGAYVKKNTLICSLDRNADMSQIIDSQMKSNDQNIASRVIYKSEQFKPLMADMKNYVVNSTNQNFDDIYMLKYNIESSLDLVLMNQDESVVSTINQLEEKNEQYEKQKGTSVSSFLSNTSGLISYYFDGFEGYTLENIAGLVGNKKLPPTNESEQKLYRLVNNRYWYLVIPADDKMLELINQQGDYKTLKFNYSKYDINMTGEVYDMPVIEGNQYVILKIYKYSDYVLKERNLDFSIKYADYQGIKIPNTAMKSKSFYEIPKEYIVKDGSEIKLKKVIVSADALTSPTDLKTEDYYPEMYYTENDVYYIPTDGELLTTDIIMSYENSDNKMSPMKTKVLAGVIIRNKGFDSFKLINIIYQGDEYVIVKDGMPYGVRVFDRILVDSKRETEIQPDKDNEK